MKNKNKSKRQFDIDNDADVSVSYLFLVKNAIPAILNNSAAPCALILNLSFFSRAGGQNWMAAWSIVQSTTTFVQGIFNFLLVVPMAQIAFLVGNRQTSINITQKDDELNRRMNVALATSGVVGGLCTWCIYSGFKNGFFFYIMNVMTEIQPMVMSYLMGRLPSIIAVFVSRVCTGILVGKQQIRLVAFINLVINSMDALLNFCVLLVFKRGLYEAGLATSFSSFIGVIIIFPVAVMIEPITKSDQNVDIRENDETEQRSTNETKREDFDNFNVIEFLKTSSNMMIRSIFLQSAMYSISITASRLGSSQLAAHQVIIQIWSLISYACDGFADVGTMVGGRLLGAKKHLQMFVLTRRLFLLGMFSGLICSVGLLWRRDQVISYFTTSNNEETRKQLDSVWLLTSLMQPINGIVFVSDGVLFAHQAFTYVRNLMVLGVLIFFGPALAFGFLKSHTLLSIWIAKSMLSFWRLLAAAWFSWNYHVENAKKENVVDCHENLTERSHLLNTKT